MEIRWLGHSCFILTSTAGTKIMMDPPDPDTGYVIEPELVDAVTASHGHHDHAYFPLALGQPLRITRPGEYALEDVKLQGFPTWHDGQQGALRGENIMFMVEMDGIRLLHAGDLGHLPAPETVAALGRVDVFLVPVGGVYTINHQEALAVCNMLKPRVVIPMHYKTPELKIELGELMPFLSGAKDCTIHRMRQPDLSLTPESLGRDRIIVLHHQKKED